MSDDVIFRTSGDLLAFWILLIALFGVRSFGGYGRKYKKRSSYQFNMEDNSRVKTKKKVASFTVSTPQGEHSGVTFQNEWKGTDGEEDYSKWYNDHVELIPGYPPSWVFSVVWSALYLMMVISFFLFVREIQYTPGFEMDVCGLCIPILVILNMTWTQVFFKLRATRWALVMTCVILALTIVHLGIFAYHGSLWPSFGLLLPNALWLVYAIYLNAAWIYVEHDMKYQK